MARRRRKPLQGEVELNLAAMLDMAFQLLTFFILTFKPSPVEAQVLLRLPPPVPVTQVAGKQAGSEVASTDPLRGLNTLIITAVSNEQGRLRQLAVGESVMGNVFALDRKLSEVFGDSSNVFDQVIVQVDERLQYDELMQIVDACTQQRLPSGQKLSRLSFVPLPVK